MKPSEVLQAALDVIEFHPEKWAKGYFAYDKYHNQTGADDPDAVCWCSVGLIQNVIGPYVTYTSPALTYLCKAVGREKKKATANISIPRYQDAKKTTHADVVRWFKAAVELAKKDEEKCQSSGQ